MLTRLGRLWDRAFLAERPSLELGLFRAALALAVGLHVWPTLFQLTDNYLAAGFREVNLSFFPLSVAHAVYVCPDWAVRLMACVFGLSWLCWLVGFRTWASGWAMTAACYFFYARNSLHVGTLSWDIMLVSLFLTVLTPWPGDSFSLDAVLAGDARATERRRPFVIQQLLRLQVASTFFYTGLCKWTASGNWLTMNPYHCLMNGPASGVIKEFPGRAFLAASPGLCRMIGLGLIAFEMTYWLWLYWRRTRPYAIAAGFAFHILLVATMHVPTIFFFLFPPLLLLFIAPEDFLALLERRRAAWARRGRDRLLFDGDCSFCRAWSRRAAAADPTGRVELVDFRRADLPALDRRLSPEALEARIHFLERGGRLTAGFSAFRRLSVRLPLLWPAAPLLHLPGLGFVGEPVYDWVARMRFALSEKLR